LFLLDYDHFSWMGTACATKFHSETVIFIFHILGDHPGGFNPYCSEPIATAIVLPSARP
jgi:hypothetical protein